MLARPVPAPHPLDILVRIAIGLDLTLVESGQWMRKARKGPRTPYDPVRSGAATSASGRIAGPFSAVPSIANWEPWHGQSQHLSNGFQCTMHPTCVHTAERRWSLPASSR